MLDWNRMCYLYWRSIELTSCRDITMPRTEIYLASNVDIMIRYQSTLFWSIHFVIWPNTLTSKFTSNYQTTWVFTTMEQVHFPKYFIQFTWLQPAIYLHILHIIASICISNETWFWSASASPNLLDFGLQYISLSFLNHYLLLYP